MTGTTCRTHGDREFAETMRMPDVPTLAQTFRDNGYQAFAAGKLHVYPQRDRIGFDDVILHTFFTDETLVRCVETVKRAAEQAGRDPETVRVWSCLATVGDHIDEPRRLKKTVGRLATYLQAYGPLMVDTNRWDPAVLAAFRADDMVQNIGGAIDAVATTDQLEHIATLLPDEWLAPSATGSAEQCASTVHEQLALGADGVILHGATPTELTPILAAY